MIVQPREAKMKEAAKKVQDGVELLTKCRKAATQRKTANKKDALRRQITAYIILFRFKAAAERRQWSSTASEPRRKTYVKLCPHGKTVFTHDWPISAIS